MRSDKANTVPFEKPEIVNLEHSVWTTFTTAKGKAKPRLFNFKIYFKVYFIFILFFYCGN